MEWGQTPQKEFGLWWWQRSWCYLDWPQLVRGRGHYCGEISSTDGTTLDEMSLNASGMELSSESPPCFSLFWFVLKTKSRDWICNKGLRPNITLFKVDLCMNSSTKCNVGVCWLLFSSEKLLNIALGDDLDETNFVSLSPHFCWKWESWMIGRKMESLKKMCFQVLFSFYVAFWCISVMALYLWSWPKVKKFNSVRVSFFKIICRRHFLLSVHWTIWNILMNSRAFLSKSEKSFLLYIFQMSHSLVLRWFFLW